MSEQDTNPSRDEIRLDLGEELMGLAQKLGLSENEEMKSLREKLKQTRDQKEFIRLLTEYQILGEHEVDKHKNETRPKAQIGLILASASIKHDQGLKEAASGDIDQAREYAYHMYYDDVLESITNITRTEDN